MLQTRTNSIAWNPMEPMNFTAVSAIVKLISCYILFGVVKICIPIFSFSYPCFLSKYVVPFYHMNLHITLLPWTYWIIIEYFQLRRGTPGILLMEVDSLLCSVCDAIRLKQNLRAATNAFTYWTSVSNTRLISCLC